MAKNRHNVPANILVGSIVLSSLAYSLLYVVADSDRSQGAAAEPVTSHQPASRSATPPPETKEVSALPPEAKEVNALSPEAKEVNALSPEAMPVGDLPGWKQIFTEDFTDGDVAIGGFPGEIYSAKWSENYFDGTPDTGAKVRQTKSGYYPSKVLSVHDGLLDWYLHSENGVSMGAAPSPKFGPSSERPFNSQTYGRYAVRFKTDSLRGFKLAWLLWPDSKRWPQDGEINHPEGDLSTHIYAAMHGIGETDNKVDRFPTETSFTSWHTAVTEWSPGRVEFFLDGQSIGVSTSNTPNKPMHYILQTESCTRRCPSPEASGHVYLDWVAIWERSPASSFPGG
ncbi:glycoside hydrolase family 16 protein [Arthrobacter sp. TMN-37]